MHRLKRSLGLMLLMLILSQLGSCTSALRPTVQIETTKQIEVMRPLKPTLESLSFEADGTMRMSKQDSIELLLYVQRLEDSLEASLD